MSTRIMGWRFLTIPFWPPSSLPAHVHTGKFSLTSGVIVLSLYFGRAQLLPLALPSECLVRTKLRFYSTGQTPAVWIRGPSISYINLAKSNFRERRGGKKAWRSEWKVKKIEAKQKKMWASLVVQCLTICLRMQGTGLRSLVWEDPTCLWATKSIGHNYCASTLEPMLCNQTSHCDKPVHCSEE